MNRFAEAHYAVGRVDYVEVRRNDQRQRFVVPRDLTGRRRRDGTAIVAGTGRDDFNVTTGVRARQLIRRRSRAANRRRYVVCVDAIPLIRRRRVARGDARRQRFADFQRSVDRYGRKRNFQRRRRRRVRPRGIGVDRPVPDRLHANVVRRVRAQAGNRVRAGTQPRFRYRRRRRKARRRRVFQRVRQRVRNAPDRRFNRRRTRRGNAQTRRRKLRRRLLRFVSAEVDRSVETSVSGQVGLKRVPFGVDGVRVVPFVERLRVRREGVIAVRRVRKERLRRVVNKVRNAACARVAPRRIARQHVVSVQLA